jgi:hypothetical protein
VTGFSTKVCEFIRLMVDLVLMSATELSSGDGLARTAKRCCLLSEET